MNLQTQQIFDEIRQLMIQYRQEVQGARKAWPESIKGRVAKLSRLGLRPKEIATQSELSYYTILSWIPEDSRRRYRVRGSGEFTPVRVREEKAVATMTVAKRDLPAERPVTPTRTNATVTVTLPGNIRIDGVTPEFLAAWLGRVQP